jgi:hypothetical protein
MMSKITQLGMKEGSSARCRHRQRDTLMIYDDNRGRDQAEVTGLLDELV